MADVKDFKPRLSSSRMFNYVKGESKDFDNGKVDDKFYNFMTSSYEKQEHLSDFGMFAFTSPLIYQLDLLKDDVDSIHRHLSESKFTNKKQKFPVVDVTDEFYVTGTTSLEGNTSISGFTDIKGDFKVNGAVVSNLKPSLDFANSLRAKTVVSSSAQIASDISGSFTSLSASIATDINNAGGGNADFSSVGENIVPDGDNTRDLGTSTKEFRNLYIDGTAYIDSLAGTTLTAPIRTLYRQVTKMKTTTLDAQSTDVFEFNISKPVTVDLITPLFAGQEITIMNIGAGAITITRSQGGKATSIYGVKNLTISQHEAYKFVCNRNQLWYVIS